MNLFLPIQNEHHRVVRANPIHRGGTFMRKYIRPVLYIVVGIIVGFPVFSLSYYTMVRTSTPGFCASCHEIEFAFNTWKTSSHTNNAHGFVADCMDCHLPAPHDTFEFFFAKTAHGAKDILVHMLGGEYDHQKMRERAWATIKNDQCLKCHRNLLAIPDKRGAMLAHRTVLNPLPGYEKKCLDCHRNLVHNARKAYDYKQKKDNYRGLGL
jgi:cytochrome c-type protein NapC/trimethylamine-N-oxide reductase cytochrome c-type subunit TorC